MLAKRELLQKYHTWAVLRGDPDIQVFIEWPERKPPAFHATTTTSNKEKPH